MVAVRFASAAAARQAGVKGIPAGVGGRKTATTRKRRPKAVVEREKSRAREAEAKAQTAEQRANASTQKQRPSVSIGGSQGTVLFSMMVVATLYLFSARDVFSRLRKGEQLV